MTYGWERDDEHDVDLELMMDPNDDCDVMPDWYYAAPDPEDDGDPERYFLTIGEMMEAMTA